MRIVVTILTLLVLTVSLGQTAMARDMTSCLRMKWKNGNNCNSPSSKSVRVYNTCTVPVYIRICLFSTRTNRWACQGNKTQPGRNFGNYVCRGNGRYRIVGCSGGERECR